MTVQKDFSLLVFHMSDSDPADMIPAFEKRYPDRDVSTLCINSKVLQPHPNPKLNPNQYLVPALNTLAVPVNGINTIPADTTNMVSVLDQLLCLSLDCQIWQPNKPMQTHRARLIFGTTIEPTLNTEAAYTVTGSGDSLLIGTTTSLVLSVNVKVDALDDPIPVRMRMYLYESAAVNGTSIFSFTASAESPTPDVNCKATMNSIAFSIKTLSVTEPTAQPSK